MNELLKLILFLVLTAAFSVFLGKAGDLMSGSELIRSAARFIMRFSRSQMDKIRFYIIWAAYILLLETGIITICLVFGFSPLHMDQSSGAGTFSEIMICTLAGFLFQFELSSVILLIFSAFKPDINWYREITEIKWISLSYKLPGSVRVVYPASAALFEEIFFRGCVFAVLFFRFPWIPVPVSAALATIMFVAEQAFGTGNIRQAIVISSGSVAISAAGCLITGSCGSIFPSLICHELYVVFYLRK